MKHIYMTAAIVISAIFCSAGLAQQSPEEILKAIVKVQAVIPDDAVTAPILGTERSGSGVLILSDLKSYGRPRQPSKPWLGVNSEESHGHVFITRILPGSPGEKSDLQIDDLILKINQLPVAGLADFYRKLWSLGNAGVSVPLTILRGTEVKEITVNSIDRYQLLKPTAAAGKKKETL